MSDMVPEHSEVVLPEKQRIWSEFRASGMADIVANYNLCHSLFALFDTGVAAKLSGSEFIPTEVLVSNVDDALGKALLRYLSVRGILEAQAGAGAYRATKRGELLLKEVPLAMLGLYRQAYGPVVEQLGPLLQKRVEYGRQVSRDGAALGKHCAVLFHHFGTDPVLKALDQMGARCILDLGCGGGKFLIDACLANPRLRGIGLDISADAIEYARGLAAEAGLSTRIQFVVANAFDLKTWPSACAEADAIMTIGTLHEEFRNGEGAVVDLLNKYADLLSSTVKGFIVGEPELQYNDADIDFFLVHAFTLQGLPRPREQWLEVFPKTKLSCRRVFSTPGAGPKFAYFDLTRSST